MNQHLFTAALAQQHRADLIAEARHARDYRRAKGTRSRGSFRLTLWRARPRTASIRPARLEQLAQAR